jgi:hypothetical protein
MEITINLLEVASELAHEQMVIDNKTKGIITDEKEVFNTDEDGCLYYKKKFQEEFDNLYDYYYDRIDKLKY